MGFKIYRIDSDNRIRYFLPWHADCIHAIFWISTIEEICGVSFKDAPGIIDTKAIEAYYDRLIPYRSREICSDLYLATAGIEKYNDFDIMLAFMKRTLEEGHKWMIFDELL